MTTSREYSTPTGQEPPRWGGPPSSSPQPPPKRWSGRKTAAAVGVAAVIAVGGGVAIYASSGSDSSTVSQQPGGMRGGPGGGTNALHGTYTVADTSGTGYHTELSQTGKVTALSATSITMISDDDYSKTYTIDSGTVVQAMGAPGANTSGSTLTISSIATGDSVSVTATASDSTVDTITEQTT
jgi:hypothetical protein